MGTRVTSTPELLERESELEALDRALGRGREGAGELVLIEGAAGLGKSRLLASARGSAAAEGAEVLEARGAALEREFAFGVVRQLFEAVVARAEAGEQKTLFAGAAALAERLFGDSGLALEAQDGDAAFGALHGLYWLTANLADRGPLVLTVDDAHWADTPSLRFLSYLSRRLEGLRVVAVAAGRLPDPEAGNPLWEELAEEHSGLVLRPRPLSGEATAEVARRRLGGADEEFCRACHDATGGNPLFLRELLTALDEAQISPTAEAARGVSTVGSPGVARFVLSRLERLGSSATSLAQAVAVLGEVSDARTAARAAGLGDTEARVAIDRLVAAEVLSASPNLAFAHPIVQAAVYDDLLPGERAARHAAAAAQLQAEGAPVERVAAHLLHAAPQGDAERVTTLHAAAVRAAQRGAPATAATYLRRALAEPPGQESRAELLADLGRREIGYQDFPAAEEHLAAALTAPGDPVVHARAATWLIRLAVATGRSADRLAAPGGLLAELEDAEGELPLELEAELVTLFMSQLPLRRLLPERMERFQRRAQGDARFEAVAVACTATERLLQAEPAADVASDLEAAMAEGPLATVSANFLAIIALRQAGRYDSANRWLELALAAARAQGLSGQLGIVHGERAWLALVQGAVADAQFEAETGIELIGEGHFMLPRLAAAAIEAAIERAELDRAARAADRAAAGGEAERLFLDEYLTARGKLRIARGETREGLADLMRVGELHGAYGNRTPADWRPHAALALAELGDEERARELAAVQVMGARSFGVPRPLGLALRVAGRTIGGEEGLALLEEAVAVLDPSPVRLELAHALTDLGAELMRRRRRREGRQMLKRAMEEALRCGATALAQRARGELGAGGGRPPRLENTGVDALTPAERRVCELAAGDRTNREVAQTLFVTEKTVELHLTSAYRKLGIRSRFQLAGALAGAEAPA